MVSSLRLRSLASRVRGRTAYSRYSALLSSVRRKNSAQQQRLFSSARPSEEFDWNLESTPPLPLPLDKNFVNGRSSPSLFLPQSLVQGEKEEKIAKRVTKVTTQQPCELLYAGNRSIPITSTLNLVTPDQDTPKGTWPVYRLLDETGYFRNPKLDGQGDQSKNNHVELPITSRDDSSTVEQLRDFLTSVYPSHRDEFAQNGLLQPATSVFPTVDDTVTDAKHTLRRVHAHMVRLREMDSILLNAQRQGRISFYLTCTGEEAIMIGVASALDNGDPLLVQYREQGMLMWRGFTLEQFCNQCYGNDLDLGKGRQMPIHYGSKALNYHTVSSPLGTQLPQAVGAAYRLKLSKQPQVAVAVFGDGCTSTPDFHSALNMAATTKSPALFICRNNGYAISTSTSEQYSGDGIVSRAPGYGVAGIRVDGNDVFAVHAAVRRAKSYALANNAPVLVECMTYRQGHHSTSDDSTQYRTVEEIAAVEPMDPLVRLEGFLSQHGVLTTSEMEAMKTEERQKVLGALGRAEQRPKVKLETLFTDVYAEMTPLLREQQADLNQHISKYPQHYSV